MGIILLPLGALVIGLYVWAMVIGTRWAFRKFTTLGAAVAIAFFVLLPTWDALINHYYFKQVLCKKPEIGLQVYEKVVLPSELYDEKGNPNIPDSFGDPQRPFLLKYVFDIRYQDEGRYPLTANRHFYHGTYDVTANRYLSKFEDYQPTGGWVWTNVFRIFLNTSDYDWIMSRGTKRSCFDRAQFGKMIGEAKRGPFVKE